MKRAMLWSVLSLLYSSVMMIQYLKLCILVIPITFHVWGSVESVVQLCDDDTILCRLGLHVPCHVGVGLESKYFTAL